MKLTTNIKNVERNLLIPGITSHCAYTQWKPWCRIFTIQDWFCPLIRKGTKVWLVCFLPWISFSAHAYE